MRKFFNYCLFALFNALFLCGCTPKINPIAEIKGTAWTPTFIANAKGIDLPNNPKKPVYIQFDKDLKISGFSGVNNLMSSCELKRKPIRRTECKIQLAPIASTKMMGEFMNFESLFLEQLASADSIRLSANKLEFLKGRKLLIEFKRISYLQSKQMQVE